MRARLAPEQKDAADLLKIDEHGRLNRDPLSKWRFRFYPESGRWRRISASRKEVSRQEVAKRVGVAEEVLKDWESAVMKLLYSKGVEEKDVG